MNIIDAVDYASDIYFYLLKKGYERKEHSRLSLFFEEDDIRQIVLTMAQRSGTQIVVGDQFVHFITNNEGSVFASGFSQLKIPYRNDRLLVQLIIFIFLVEIDGIRSLADVTYFELEHLVFKVLESWKKKEEEDPTFAQKHQLAASKLYDEWNKKLATNENLKNLVPSTNTRMQMIHLAMRKLEEEGLVAIIENKSVLAKDVLYERMREIYKDESRLHQLRNLVLQAKEE
ncbi:hypothetical protein D3C74_99900 [compost metagenome]